MKETVIITAMAIIGALLVFGAFVEWMGVSALDVYASIYIGGFGSWYAWQETLSRASPLILAGLCTAIPAQAGLIIIGGEGAILIGGLVAAIAGLQVAGAGAWAVVPLVCLTGAAAGGAWIGLCGVLRHFRGVQETIASLLLAFLAVDIFNFFIEGPLRAPGTANYPATGNLGSENMLGQIPGMDVSWGLVVALCTVAVAFFLLYVTTYGFAIRIVGGNVRAARLVGLSVGRYVVATCVAGGAAAGLAGALQVVGVHGHASEALHANYGYMGILVAFLARHHPLGVVAAAILTGGIGASSGLLQMQHGLPDASSTILQGIVFVLIMAAETLYGRSFLALLPWFRVARPQ